MIDRQMARPSPRPSFFVVKNGWNTNARRASAIPCPESLTLTVIMSGAYGGQTGQNAAVSPPLSGVVSIDFLYQERRTRQAAKRGLISFLIFSIDWRRMTSRS
jgi:hypothetical protein